MKNIGKIRIVLDIILTLAILSLFSKQFFGMHYHEVAGIVVIVTILIHIGINIKMAKAMASHFTSIPFKLKLNLIIDIILLISFISIGISGVLISKTILTGISTTNMLFKIYHMCLSGFALMLLGVHIGLHLCSKKLNTLLALIITVISLALGICGFSNTSLLRWISMPFTAANTQQGNNMHGMDHSNRPDFASESVSKQAPANFQNNKSLPGSTKITDKLFTYLQFLGIMFSFTMLTYWIFISRSNKK